MNEIDPLPAGRGRRIGIAVARFNAEVTEMLLDGCRAALLAHDVDDDDIVLVRTPGAWELPLACRSLVETGRFDAVIALGAVVRGETAHFEFISDQCAQGLQQLALECGVPVAFGVLTPENGDQARERADPERGDKGREAALAALEMISLQERVAALGVVDGR
ncbi:MAG: 6,7-dimethyl-8-ribityllumazine synthase [Candidatus Wenzhouxiangella sp. M2_3B_020]